MITYTEQPIKTTLETQGSLSDPLSSALVRFDRGIPDRVGYPDTVVPVMKTPSIREEITAWIYETGTGTVKEGCGTVLRTVAACNRHPGEHKPLLIPNSCGRAACPVCWDVWAERAGVRVRDSLEGYLSIVYGNSQKPLAGLKKESLRARHIVFSPPHSLTEELIADTLQEADAADFQRVFLQKFRRAAISVVRGAGVVAGVIFEHDIRLKTDSAAVDQENDINRYREILDRPDWRDHVEFSPHVHILGYGYLEDSSEFYEESGGWIYRTIRVVDDPELVVKYLLSHAPTVPNRCAYARFGRMHSRYMEKVKEYRCREYIACEECLEAGVSEAEAVRVIATLAVDPGGTPALKCEHDGDIGARHRAGGRGDPVSWSFESISNWKYSRVKHRSVYRLRSPRGGLGPGPGIGEGVRVLGGRPPDPRVTAELGRAVVNLDRFPYRVDDDRLVWVGSDRWDELMQRGIISSWYGDPPGDGGVGS